MRGTMVWFNEEKHHGVILTETGEKVQVLRSGFVVAAPEGSCNGLEVDFEIVEDDGGRRAESVRLVPEVAPRRARRRRGQ